MKKDNVKNVLLSNLEKVPIVTFACERAGISRNSVYRWRKEDLKFRRQMMVARAKGVETINDITENQLFMLIKEGNWPAIRFWLTRRHKDYIPDRQLIDALARLEKAEDRAVEIINVKSSLEMIKLMEDLGIWQGDKYEHLPGKEKLEKIDKDMREKYQKLEKLFKLIYGDEDNKN